MGQGQKGIILLAEDDPDQVEVLVEVLTQEGYRVLAATQPAEVVRQLAARPEVVLLDLIGVSTPEVLQAIRQAPWRPAMLLVSGDTAVAVKARELNAQGFLAKPFDLSELTRAIESALRARESATAGEEAGR